MRRFLSTYEVQQEIKASREFKAKREADNEVILKGLALTAEMAKANRDLTPGDFELMGKYEKVQQEISSKMNGKPHPLYMQNKKELREISNWFKSIGGLRG